MTTPREIRRLVLRQLRPGRRAGIALSVAILISLGLPLLAPQLTRWFIDGAIAGEPTRALVLIAVGYLGLAISGQAARVLTAWLGGGGGRPGG
jgi:ATP-binding cassette, subfamily B, bacterial